MMKRKRTQISDVSAERTAALAASVAERNRKLRMLAHTCQTTESYSTPYPSPDPRSSSSSSVDMYILKTVGTPTTTSESPQSLEKDKHCVSVHL
jgi:hypothetical protein